MKTLEHTNIFFYICTHLNNLLKFWPMREALSKCLPSFNCVWKEMHALWFPSVIFWKKIKRTFSSEVLFLSISHVGQPLLLTTPPEWSTQTHRHILIHLPLLNKKKEDSESIRLWWQCSSLPVERNMNLYILRCYA